MTKQPTPAPIPCAEWRDRLLSLALENLEASEQAAVTRHVESCFACRSTLTAMTSQQEKLEGALQHLASGLGPSAGFQARVTAIAANAETRTDRRSLTWPLAFGAAAAVVVALLATWPASRGSHESILRWRSPTASLLRSPSDAWLRSTPRLGQGYGPITDFLPNADFTTAREEEP